MYLKIPSQFHFSVDQTTARWNLQGVTVPFVKISQSMELEVAFYFQAEVIAQSRGNRGYIVSKE